jgi:hypothetical protein
MKIFLCDYAIHKTTKHWFEYLKANHEVVTDMYFNPVYAEWADIIYIEWCETSAQQASEGEGDFEGVYDHEGVRGEREKQYSGHFSWKGKPMFIRPIDIDVYYGHFRGIKWENVTALLYIAKHIGELLNRNFTYPPNLKQYHVPLSVKLDDWKFRERDGTGKQIAWINHNWSGKGLPLMLQAFDKLIRFTNDKTWHLHIVSNGQSNEYWFFEYCLQWIKSRGLEANVTWHDAVPNVDEFLDDKDYLISSSYKEAFALILAEAMAKGIKALTHNWWGAEDIWPKEMVWETVDEFPIKMMQNYDSNVYRKLAEQYSSDKEIALLREITGL